MTDDLLIFTDKVEVVPSAKGMSIFQNLLNLDKSVKKGTYQLQLNYLYYVWTRSSPFFERYTPAQREDAYFSQIDQIKPNKIYCPELQAAVKFLMRHLLTQSEGQYQQLLIDFDKFLVYLNEIPWEREEEEDITIGKKVTHKLRKVSNQDERMKAIANSSKILSLQKELEKIIKEERKEKAKGNAQLRTFENPEVVEMMNAKYSVKENVN